MWCVSQKKPGHPGDCFAACLASLLELPLEIFPAPTWADMKPLGAWDRYLETLEEGFLKPLGYYLRHQTVPVDEEPPPAPPGYTIGSFRVCGGGCNHAVVLYQDRVVWDPNPRRAEIRRERLLAYTYLVPFDPSVVHKRMRRRRAQWQRLVAVRSTGQ